MKLERNFGNLSDTQIAELENRLNVTLPDDYKRFLSQTNGGVIDLDTNFLIHIDDINEEASVDVLFGLTPQNSVTDLLYWNDTYGDDMFEDSIIIGTSLENGFIVLICSEEDPGVYYWDDTYHFEQSDDESNTYFITDTFTDFLKQCP